MIYHVPFIPIYPKNLFHRKYFSKRKNIKTWEGRRLVLARLPRPHDIHAGEDKPSPLPYTGTRGPAIADLGCEISSSGNYEPPSQSWLLQFIIASIPYLGLLINLRKNRAGKFLDESG
jgi:hypothetical protein